MTDTQAVLTVAVTAAVTLLLRMLPFIILGEAKKTPPFIMWLGNVLPYAIMGMLSVYCLRGVSFASAVEYVPPSVSVLVVVLLHIWRRNTLISILGGTVCYMILVQAVF